MTCDPQQEALAEVDALRVELQREVSLFYGTPSAGQQSLLHDHHDSSSSTLLNYRGAASIRQQQQGAPVSDLVFHSVDCGPLLQPFQNSRLPHLPLTNWVMDLSDSYCCWLCSGMFCRRGQRMRLIMVRVSVLVCQVMMMATRANEAASNLL